VARVNGWVSSCFRNEYAPVIVVSEGAVIEGMEVLADTGTDAFGHRRLGGVGTWLAEEIERATGAESRAVVLGHVQRGGVPTAFDRVLATRFGIHAVAALHEGASGSMVALRGTDIVRVPLADATSELKTVPDARLDEAEIFFG
jgi:6-phosphofructokinase 1